MGQYPQDDRWSPHIHVHTCIHIHLHRERESEREREGCLELRLVCGAVFLQHNLLHFHTFLEVKFSSLEKFTIICPERLCLSCCHIPSSVISDS